MGKYLLGLILLNSAARMFGQSPDDLLNRAYQALREKDYDRAIQGFRQAIAAAPGAIAARKDLGYTLLKIGETEDARDQFAEAMKLDPKDDHLALEYAFLCYETKEPAIARRIFDRLQWTGNATAREAFENVDRPLREGIARWQQALSLDPENFSAHEELAKLADQRDDHPLAAEHYEKAWRLRPDRRDLLIDLGKAWTRMNRTQDALAAWIAAWRGGTPRVSDQARELLPARYPYLSEFEAALALDPGNGSLRRDVAFQRGEPAPPEDPKPLAPRPENPAANSGDAKELGLRSLEKGYLADALKYLSLAHEDEPADFEVMLKLGWAYNMLKDDRSAERWFDLARHSSDPAIAAEASKAYHSLKPSLEKFRTTFWLYPIYSSRWKDLFAYAQVKTEVQLARVPLRPYVSVRFLGDARGAVDAGFGPQYLSEHCMVFGAGVATIPWRGITGWFEAGRAVSYRSSSSPGSLSDYRGGVSYAKGFGHLLGNGSHGLFAETATDGVFLSRFGNDSLAYSQNRAGYTLRQAEGLAGFHAQLLWNANITADAQRQYWANYFESGPGVRFRFNRLPSIFSLSFLRGAYTVNDGNPRRPNYNEVRVGVWYAFTR